jgi:hypothetical protein
VPEIVKKHHQTRRGYANYYFNKLNRDQVWDAWAARSDLASQDGTWTIRGPLDDGDEFRFELSDSDAALKLPLVEHTWAASDEIGSSSAPPGSGGLLPALHLWRRLAVEGAAEFGEVYYLGTVPLSGRDGLVDVLVGIHGGVECRFLFDPSEGHLLAMEMFPEEHADPCEIYFLEHRELEGRWLPRRMEVRFGDDPYAAFRLDTWEFQQTKQP